MDIGIRTFTQNADKGDCQSFLADFLAAYLDPAFAALPAKEVDLLVLDVLIKLGFINQEPDLYELVTKLRVTRPKARNLLYDRELRRLKEPELEALVRQALKDPILQKQGDLFVLEIENPLVIDHLRSKLKALRHASDGSFSPSLVRISLDAMTDLIEATLTDKQREAVRKALVNAGAPDTSFKGVIKSTAKAVAKKLAQEAGEALVDKAGDVFGPIVDGAVDKIVKITKGLFGREDK